MRAVAGGVVVLALGFWGCRSRAPEHAQADAALAALVPHDAVAIAGLRVAAIRETPPYKKVAPRQWSGEFDKFAKETGFDFRTDLSELLVCSNGNDTLVLAKGKFSPAGLEAKLARPGTRKTNYKGYALIGSDQAGVVFLNSGTAAAGPITALRAMIDRKERSQGGIPEKLLERVKSIPPENQIWAVTMGTGPLAEKAIPESGNLQNLRRILASVESTIVAINLHSGLKVDAKAECRTGQDAKFIHDSLRGLIGMGRLTTPDNEPELLRFYDSFSIVKQENTVRVQAEVPMDVLEKFLEKAGEREARL